MSEPVVVRTAGAARATVARLPRPIALVPTMGALHPGHLRLVEAARRTAASVVVSVFVNPLQFGPGEDFARYPRALPSDLAALSTVGVESVYAPDAADVFPTGFGTSVAVDGPARGFEGDRRPGHFSGVATIVLKLLNVIRPERLVLGRKDAQQVAVLARMVADLELGIEVIVVPTDREHDGLARSSRNVYLSASERAAAPSLYRVLSDIAARVSAGEESGTAIRAARELLAAPLEAEYLAVVDGASFAPVARAVPGALAIGAVRAGTTRLLDNVPLTPA